MAITLVALLPRALVGFAGLHPLSLTAPFGDSIAIPPNTGIIEDSRKPLNKQIQKRNQAKGKKTLKKD